MDTLVSFLMINNIQPINDFFKYTENIINKLYNQGLITNAEIPLAYKDFGSNTPIIETTDNNFVIDYNYSKKEISTNWKLEFVFGTFNSSKQLEINISSNDYNIKIDDDYLERLKFTLKKELKSDWEKIVWLMDKDSEMLSITLYPSIYRVENLARKLINEIMVKEYGLEWWDMFVPIQIQKKHRARMSGYKSVVPGFANVDERLMSIDIGDLITILTLKEKKWVPEFNEKISHFLNDHIEIKLENLQSILVNQMETTRDLWIEQFSKYLSDDFIKYLKTFELNRNHVVHNKLIDRYAYYSILKSINDVKKELEIGLQKISESVISVEQREEIAEILEMNYQEQEAMLHMIMESEANVEIRNTNEIIDLFNEHLYEFYTQFQSNLRFRNDIDIGEYQDISISEERGVLFKIEYKIDNEIAEVNYEFGTIVDSQGEENSVIITIQKGAEKFSNPLRYINGKVTFNSYQGNYMPEVQDEFFMSDLDVLMDGFLEFIDKHFVNMREKIDLEMYSIIKDGGMSPFADIPCCGCGEDYICIDENYGVWGQCLNCGEKNDIRICDRCGCCFEEENEDGLNICGNCLSSIEKE